MGRKKFNIDDKKSNFGITLNPELVKILEEQSEKEGISKSKLIEDVMREFIKNKKDNERKS
jgi:metal-responsive CopG/Arc/MetJ family transcriptional regulator